MANQQNSVEISEEKKEILEKYHLKFNDDLIGNKFRIRLKQDMKNFIDNTKVKKFTFNFLLHNSYTNF